MKHRGEILENVVRKSKIPIAQIAGDIGYTRTSIYNHFKEPNLEFEILYKYAKAVRHDFTVDFPEMATYVASIQSRKFEKKEIAIDEALNQIEYWKDRYIDLLEKHQGYIDKYQDLMEKYYGSGSSESGV